MEREPEGPAAPPHEHDSEANAAVEPATSENAGLSPEEEPTTTGTLFIMILFLMALAGMWGIMYLTLLNR
jgi:hypothetical protein